MALESIESALIIVPKYNNRDWDAMKRLNDPRMSKCP